MLWADVPMPVVGWCGELLAAARLDDPFHYDTEILPCLGTDQSLAVLRLMPSAIDARYASQCRPTWTNGRTGAGALRLCAADAGAESGAVVQAGEGPGALKSLGQLTLFVAFRLDAGMSYGGGSPPWELDGTLMSLAPGVTLAITGRGQEGRGRRLPQLRLSGTAAGWNGTCDSVYTPRTDTELRLGQWYTLVVTWDGAKPSDLGTGAAPRVRMWLNGRELPIARTGHPSASPDRVEAQQAPLVGGDRQWGNTPIDLDTFAIFDRCLDQEQIGALPSWYASPPGRGVMPVFSHYQVLADANDPRGWQEPEGLGLSAAGNGILRVQFSGVKTDERRRMLLAKPMPLDTGVTSVDFWACVPPSRAEYGYSIVTLFADAAGKEIPGDGLGFLDSHVAAPNARASGQWRHVFCEIPRASGATQFLGFAVTGGYVGPPEVLRDTKSIFVKDVALERIDYRQARLYYVVGNYRDNFMNTGFNGCGARALTELSGGSDQPYVLLDNLLDQAKVGRPRRINLRLFAYDTSDRLVHSAALDDLPAESVPDFWCPIPLPITTPGTYRIEGKSYDAATGEYFTTDWVKLIIIKGGGASSLTPATASDQGSLAINPQRPFGRLEKTDPREIAIHVGSRPGVKFPLELRYDVLPYADWVPVWQAVREVPLSHKVTVKAPGVVTVSYVPAHAVELVIAELWYGNTRIDREERPIGVRNELDRAPEFAARAQVPSLDDFAGPGKNWFNAQLHLNPGDDALASFQRNLAEAKKLTPLVGFCPDINRLEPIPGVYDWDYLTPILDLAERNGCRVVPYLNLKWPVDWAPVEFQLDGAGCAHRGGLMWGYMIGKYLYCSGEKSPEIIRDLNTQFARRYLNHPGMGAYYFEDEHIDSYNGPLNSYHPAYQKAFATFLKGRYATVDALNKVYAATYRAFEDIPLPDPARPSAFPRKVMFADLRIFQRQTAENFVLRDEFDAVRHEDPRRPIIVYNIGGESDAFLRHIADNGGMMANGGIHSNFNFDFEYERDNAIPGLRYRMEPHDMYDYDPVPHGFDEMIFGMLAMGGRGLNFHEFLRGFGTIKYDDLMKPGQPTGLDKLVAHVPMLRELRDAEKLHDAVGMMQLRSPQDYFRGPFEWGIWCMHCAVYALNHYNPKTAAAEGRPDYLDGSKVIFVGGSIIDAGQLAYLRQFLQGGGKIVMDMSAGQWSLERPDEVKTHCLLDALGVDFFAPGQKLAEVKWPHDIYAVGAGQVLVMRRPLWNDQWEAVVPAIMKWAGVGERLADSDDRYMQMHVLQKGDLYYLATTHRGEQQSGYNGPDHWAGKVRFLKPLPAGNWRVTEMMSGEEVGVFTAEQLAAGIDAGEYAELQMKVFRIRRE
jgi:hypothetical protein